MRFEATVPYTPQQNGVSERLNRTLTTAVRCLLEGAHLPAYYWGLALYAANYLRNRLPTRAIAKDKTPYELWHSRRAFLGHTRVWGCLAYVIAPKERRQKLDNRAWKGVFVGYRLTT